MSPEEEQRVNNRWKSDMDSKIDLLTLEMAKVGFKLEVLMKDADWFRQQHGIIEKKFEEIEGSRNRFRGGFWVVMAFAAVIAWLGGLGENIASILGHHK